MSFAYKGTLTLTADSGLLPATQTDYPLLVSVTNDVLKQTGSGGQVTQADADDINFFSDSGLTSLLSWEVEFYDGTAGTLIAWVKISSLALSGVFYMGIGDAAVTTFQGGATGAAWNSNFKLVHHTPDGTTLGLLDSTAEGNNGTGSGTPTAIAGKIDGGIGLASASSQYYTIPNDTDYAVAANRSYLAWFKGTTDADGVLFGFCTTAANLPYFTIEIGPSTATLSNELITILNEPTGVAGGLRIGYTTATRTELFDDNWHRIAVTMDGSAYAIYLDGISKTLTVGSGSNNGTPSINAWTKSTVGSQQRLSPYGYVNGNMDEMYIVAAALSANWVTIDYNSQNDNATFLSKSFAVISGGGKGPLVRGGSLTKGALIRGGRMVA